MSSMASDLMPYPYFRVTGVWFDSVAAAQQAVSLKLWEGPALLGGSSSIVALQKLF